MPTVLPCDFADFFAPLGAQLLKLGAVADLSWVIPTATDEVPHYTADRDVLLWPQEEVSNEATDTGGGRHDTRAAATLFVVARSRVGELDEAVSNRQAFLNANAAHYAFRAALRNALHDFWPADAKQNLLGVQPLKWRRTQAPAKDRKARGWLASVLEFYVPYPVAFSPQEFTP